MQELESRLRSGDLGDTAESIISLCKQVAELDQLITRDDRNSLLKRVQISIKKWERLCKVGKDGRLMKYHGNLPPNLAAIYALTTLGDDELNDGMITGDLYENISSRKIYAYGKACRLTTGAFTGANSIFPCYLVASDKGEEIDIDHVGDSLKEANRLLLKRGLMILGSVSSTSKFDQKQKELIAKEQKQGEVETNIEHQMYMLSEGLHEHYSLEEINAIMEGSMGQFVRALLSISKSRLQMMEVYGVLYCYKVSLEYHRSNSRVQRFNYKRRLINVQQKYRFLSSVVDRIFDEYVERPRTKITTMNIDSSLKV